MEKSHTGISLKNCFMKKIFALAASLILVVVSANSQSEKKEPPPPTPPPKVNITKFKPPTITAKGDKANDFYKRNPSVSEISKQGNIIILKMKDGTRQEYNINKNDEMKSFTDQYGESPLPPPPPPPPKKIS